jgi:PAS domain S-box-containing protein
MKDEEKTQAQTNGDLKNGPHKGPDDYGNVVEALEKETEAHEKTVDKLQASNEILESIFSNIQFLVAYMDSNFNFIRVNKAYAQAAGHFPEFFFGKNHFDLYPNKENETIFRRVVETGKPYVTFEKSFENPAQTGRGVTYWDWTLQPISDTDRKVIGLVLSLVDVTEQKQAREQLIAYTKKLEWSNRELQEFASVASHDLHEPLRKIQTFCGLLKDEQAEKLDDIGHDYLRRMEDAAKRMQAMLDALLNYSRITTKANPLIRIDLTDALKEALSNLEARIGETNASIEFETLPTIESDRVQMIQLFQNIIANSLKFYRKNIPPLVEIKGKLIEKPRGQEGSLFIDKECEIRIEDNGTGFDEKYLSQIFLPFRRLHSRMDYEGTGMGLAICRKIVERHEGTITAESTPNVGSTFIVRLPVKQPER